jgi:hypothetical protein
MEEVAAQSIAQHEIPGYTPFGRSTQIALRATSGISKRYMKLSISSRGGVLC